MGSSGTLLTILMGRAMNRSLANVLFGAFGAARRRAGRARPATATAAPSARSTPNDVATMLAYADRVIVVPGYGLAVAQAQHTVRELADELEKRGVEVSYAIHPVAGRMPGHMNVLLAEADVPYEALKEMDEINPEFPQHRRGARDRRQRRHEPGRARRPERARSTACRSSRSTRPTRSSC